MATDEYALLRRENDRRFQALAVPNRNTVANVMDTVQKVSWNLYEIERVRKDMIDMAREAERQNTTLARTLGPDRQALYDEITREIEPGTFGDWFWSRGARPGYLLHVGVLVLDALSGINRITAMLMILWGPALCLNYLAACLNRRIWVSRWPRVRRNMWTGVLMTAVIAAFTAAAVALTFVQLPRLTTYIAVVLELLFYIVSYFVRCARYNRAAARRPWRSAEDAAGEDHGAP